MQPTCYWWFAYTMLLKLVINVIFLLGKSRDFRWGMWLQITLVASALVSHWVRPYVLMNDNRFEQLVFLCIACALGILNSRTAAEMQNEWPIQDTVMLSLISTIMLGYGAWGVLVTQSTKKGQRWAEKFLSQVNTHPGVPMETVVRLICLPAALPQTF